MSTTSHPESLLDALIRVGAHKAKSTHLGGLVHTRYTLLVEVGRSINPKQSTMGKDFLNNGTFDVIWQFGSHSVDVPTAD